MKYEKKPLECRGETYEPPRSIEETLAIVAKARKRLGRTVSRRTTAKRLVLDNLPMIEDLRERGYKQEDAVLLILELTNDAHKPDTIRKAIAAEVGPWSNAGNDVANVVDAPRSSDSVPPESAIEDEEVAADDEGGASISEGDYL